MTHFMAYVILLSAGIGACALVVEFLFRTRLRATRWMWVSALAAVLVVTIVATFAPRPVNREEPAAVSRLMEIGETNGSLIVMDKDRTVTAAALRVSDAVLPALWLVSSVLLLAAILYGQRRLHRDRIASRPANVNGRDVLVTDNVGPAVAGVGSPVVLLPRWALALDAASQELLLAHEFEHVKEGDTRVLLTGAIATALMPWNPVLWWISRRLRLAVEQDCDSRVLRAHPDVRRYADLLLMAAGHRGMPARLLSAHFGEHRSDLDRRIETMTDGTFRWKPTLAAAVAAGALLVASCEAPRPEPLAPRPGNAKAASVALIRSEVEKQVTQAAGSISPAYPNILREAGVEGEVLVSFVVDEQGKADVESFKVIRATHELFAVSVKKALPEMRFVPAEAGGRKVKQLVEQPFTFTLAGTKRLSAGSQSTTGTLEEVAITGVPNEKRLAYTIRRNEREVPADPINVVIYSIDGNELARGEDVLKRVDPQSIHSIEVYRPNRCPADRTCPLIRITLAKGKTLGGPIPMRSTLDQITAGSGEPRAEKKVAFQVNRADILSSPMNYELLDSKGEVLARYGSRAEVRMINSHDISASRTYSAQECAALSGVTCPLTRIWFKAGREGAYRKR